MDIRKWLDETVLPKQQEPHLFLSSNGAEQPPRKRPRRKRSTSDSSLLQPLPRHPETSQTAHDADIDGRVNDRSRRDAYHLPSQSSEPSSTLSQQYARQPRRKTRLERYEPPAKDADKGGKQVYRRRRGESKKTKRKPRRKKGNKPDMGLPRSFQAENVPKDRLTLRPRAKLGIFSKGKASSPVKGRGLPDLVFSEMKFLQKRKDQPDAIPQSGFAKKKRRKDHAQARQEEISTYFTSARPALADLKDVNTQAKEGHYRRVVDHEKGRSTVTDSAIPTIELHNEASCQRFGNECPRHESESYISWSDSGQVPSPNGTPLRPRVGSTINVGQLGSIQGDGIELNTQGGGALHPQAAPSSLTRHLTDGSGGRFNVSSIGPTNQRVSRSHTFPQRTSSPRPLNFHERKRGRTANDICVCSSSMPPPLPIHAALRDSHHLPLPVKGASSSHCPPPCLQESNLASRQSEAVREQEETKRECGLEPPRSSSLGRLLRECDSAFNTDRHHDIEAHRLNDHGTGHFRLTNDLGQVANTPFYNYDQVPTVRFSGVETCPPIIPNFLGPNIYEEQTHRAHMLWECSDEDGNAEDIYSEAEYIEDDVDAEYQYENQRRQTLPQAASYPTMVWAMDESTREPLEYDDGGGDLGEGPDVVARGFWRPHNLY